MKIRRSDYFNLRKFSYFFVYLAILVLVLLFLGIFLLKAENHQVYLRGELNQLCTKIELHAFDHHKRHIAEMAVSDAILDFFDEHSQEKKEAVLSTFNLGKELFRASIIFLMNVNGDVLVSTTVNGNETLEGLNYSFRPYFQRAMARTVSVYPAVGVTTHERGLYFSSPVTDDADRIVGVLVVKLFLSDLDMLLSEVTLPAAVATSDGIIFATNNPTWLYKTLSPLSADTKSKLKETKQFADIPISGLDWLFGQNRVLIEDDWWYLAEAFIGSEQYRAIMIDEVNKPFPITMMQTVLIFVALIMFVVFVLIVSVLVVNIKQRRIAEVRIAASERRFRTILETTLEGFWQLSNMGKIITVNPSLCSILGGKREEIVNKSIYGFVDKENEKLLRQQKKIRKKGVKSSYELRMIGVDGREIYCLVKATPYYDDHGKKIGSFAMITDITERKKDEEELKRLKFDLEQEVNLKTNDLIRAQDQLLQSEKLAAIGKLGGTVAHEFRNQLGVMRNSAYFLKMKIKDKDEKVQKHLKIMEAEIVQTDKIIESILAFARVTTPKTELIDLKKLIVPIIGKVALSKTYGVSVDVKILDTCPSVTGDKIQLTQVFMNIIKNAFDAVGEGGSVCISTLEEEKRVACTIQDNGPGMSAEVQSKIFEPLFTTKARGTGLGMPTVKMLIERNNGEIRIESKEGMGAQITVYLPKSENQD